jgi:hypothetical protein
LQGLQGRSNIGKNTSTACLTATQETTGTARNTNNSRDAKTGGNISKRRHTMQKIQGRLTAEKII